MNHKFPIQKNMRLFFSQDNVAHTRQDPDLDNSLETDYEEQQAAGALSR